MKKKVRLAIPWLMALLWFISFNSYGQSVIAYWDFDNEAKRTLVTEADPDDLSLYTADVGTGTINLFGGPAFAGWVLGAVGTEGSLFAPNSNGWDDGAGTKYWQITTSTTGFDVLKLSSIQRGSNTGPKEFKVQYSTDGSIWTDVPGAVITVANNFTTGVLDAVLLPVECDNQETLHLRWLITSNTSVNDGTVGSGGTNRIDGILLTSGEPPLYESYFHLGVVDGNRPAWMPDAGHTERGLTADATSVYVASRNAGTHVLVLDRLTGLQTGTLNTTGIEGGFWVLNDIEVSADGHRIGFNMFLNGGTFKAYLLDETDPVQVLFSTEIAAGRFGDKVTLVGSLEDGSAMIFAGNGSALQVLKWTMVPAAGGTWEFNNAPEVITLSGDDIAAGATPAVAPLPDGTFYWSANGQSVHKFAADGTKIGTIPGTLLATGTNAMKFLGHEGADEILAVFAYGANNEKAKIVRVVNAVPEDAELIFDTPTLRGPGGANPNGTGDVAFIPYPDGNVAIYVLSTNVGIGGYASLGLDLEFPVYEPSVPPVPEITEFPYHQNFDDAEFPPAGYTNVALVGTATWTRVTTGTNPTTAPQNGAGMIRYNAYNQSSGNSAALITPKVIIPGTEYQVKFSMYRDTGYATTADRVEVWVNDTPGPEGAVSLGVVNRSTTLAPVVPAAGWYDFAFAIPDDKAGDIYIIFQAISGYGNNIFVDAFTIEEAPTSPVFAVTPLSRDFGTVNIGSVSAAQIFTISNAGAGTLVINPADISLVGADADQFVLTTLTETANLEAGESATFTVAFAPTTGGVKNATVEIEDNLGGKVIHEIALTGTGFDPVLVPPFTEDFNTTPFPPMNWERLSGILGETTTLVSGALWFHHNFGNTGGPNNSAYLNVYATRNHWLITPPVNLGDGTADYRLTFDIALTPWTGAAQSTLGPNDYIAVVISTDNGETWSNANVLIDWDATDVISPTGNHIVLSLDGYTGIVKFGFYVERPSGNLPDLRFYVDNVTVEEVPESPLFAINPTSKDFGTVGLDDQSLPQVFTISNAGPGTLAVNAPVLDNTTDFILSFVAEDFPAELSGTETVTFSVVFIPQTEGVKEGEITIGYGGTETATVVLTGTGLDRPAGSTCGNPMVMTLPVIDYQDNTEAYGNDYLSAWINPTSSYLNGYDFVAQFTLDEPGFLSGSVAGSWTGLLIVEDCPNPSNPANLLAAAVGSVGGSFSNVWFEAGTYFAIVSTWPTPNFTDFTLNLSVTTGAMVTFHVAEDVTDGDPIEGAVIAITGYPNLTTDALGMASVDLVDGTYTASISKVGYAAKTVDFTVAGVDIDVEVALMDNIVTPFNLEVLTEGLNDGEALFSWNNVYATPEFADGFEAGNFDAWHAFIQGPGTPGEGGNAYWFATNVVDGGAGTNPEGSYVAKANWGYNINTWLISPEMEVLSNTAVTFHWNGSYFWSVDPNPNAQLMVKVSTDGGDTWTTIWDWQEIGVWTNWTWYETTVSLIDYVGQDVHVAINLVGDDNATTQIDDVFIGTSTKSGTIALGYPAASEKDVRFAPAGGFAKAFVGYNVYLDDLTTPVATVPDTDYLFENLEAGEYTAGVQAVYTTGASEIVTIDFVIEGAPIETHAVTFNVNMTYAEDFDPATDVVYFTGSIFGWATPGDQPENQTMTRVDDSMVWTKTIELEAETYAYKYFLNAGWDGGEWQGGDDRVLVVEDDMEVNDWFGYLTDPTTVTDPSLEQIRVFPVPARTTLYVTSPETIREVRIIDMLGQIAYTSSVAGLRHEVNIGSFKNGIYFIQIFTEKGIETRRIQVQK